MRRRNPWIFFGAFLALLISAMFVPDLRLNAELAAARREGLWTTPEEIGRDQKPVPAELNAMTLIEPLVTIEKSQREGQPFGLSEAIRNLTRGKASSAEKTLVWAWFKRRPDLAAKWRAALKAPAFSSGTVWTDGFDRVWKAEPLRLGVSRLLAASDFGIDARENLIGAARLGALSRNEPGLLSQGLRYLDMESILARARALGVVREVNAAFGAPADIRLAYRGLMADQLAEMEQIRSFRRPNWGSNTILNERIRQLAPFAAATKQRVVQQWRQLWKELPADPTDYFAAAKVFDRNYPRITTEIGNYSHVIDGMAGFHHSGAMPGDALRRIGQLEALRKESFSFDR